MNILEQIVACKKTEVEERLSSIKKEWLYNDTEFNSTSSRVPLNFYAALQRESLSIIAEVKKASPSKGVLREQFNALEIAQQYEEYGAHCLSVLTDEIFFQGNATYLTEIKKNTRIPILRKDFIIDPRQIRESYQMGADAILLIVAILSKDTLSKFKEIAESFGLSCLVEVHSQKELEIALELKCNLIGINNRNLKTFETNLQNSLYLKKQIPESTVVISESGIQTKQDCELLWEHGFNAVLVGETLIRKNHPGKAIHELLGKL